MKIMLKFAWCFTQDDVAVDHADIQDIVKYPELPFSRALGAAV
jgi:hypothetical protein